MSGSRGQFSHKVLDVTFKLGTGSFGEAGFNTVKLTGLRVSATVVKSGEAGFFTMQLRLWGLTFEMMNKLSTFGIKIIQSEGIIQSRAEVLLEAGDALSNARSTVFHGTISQAWVDFQGMPDVMLHCVCNAGGFESLKPVKPQSYRGLVNVADIMASIVQSMGPDYKLENSGVTAQVVDPYLPGTATEQYQRLAEMAHINAKLDDKTLAIWPKGGQRGKQVPLISPSSGMQGYPAYAPNGIIVTSTYNPAFIPGGHVKVQSSLPRTEGTWQILALTHTLDAEIPGGNWFTRMELLRLGDVAFTSTH